MTSNFGHPGCSYLSDCSKINLFVSWLKLEVLYIYKNSSNKKCTTKNFLIEKRIFNPKKRNYNKKKHLSMLVLLFCISFDQCNQFLRF